MSRYKVMIDDNFHYMDTDHRLQNGVFPTTQAAIAACKEIVDADLRQFHKPGITAKELYEMYTMFGDDPFVVPTNPVDRAGRFLGFGITQKLRARS